MFFITDQVQKGNISIKYCPTDDMTGEYMTKPLHGEKYASFRQDVMNLATKSVVVTYVVTKRTAASKTNNSGCKKCKRGKSPVVDGKVFDAFAEGSQIAQTKMQELRRHNGFMEVLEETKLAMEVREKIFLLTRWNCYRGTSNSKMRMDGKKIKLSIKFFPEMESVIKAQSGEN
jgi:Na+-transporting NADH:ubiquinone oxidoreductase subunit NqrF